MKRFFLFFSVIFFMFLFTSCGMTTHKYVAKNVLPEEVTCLTKIITRDSLVFFVPSEQVGTLKPDNFFDFDSVYGDGYHFFDCTSILYAVLDSGYLKARIVSFDLIKTLEGNFFRKYSCVPLNDYRPCFCNELFFYSEDVFTAGTVVKFKTLIHGPDDNFITGFEYLSSGITKKDSAKKQIRSYPKKTRFEPIHSPVQN